MNRTIKVFELLTTIFGHAWTSQFKTEELQKSFLTTWNNSMKNYSDNQIRLALEKCKDPSREIHMPPTLPKFLSLCCIDMKDIGITSRKGNFENRENDNGAWKSILSWDRDHMRDIDLRSIYAEKHAEIVDNQIKHANKFFDEHVEALGLLNKKDSKKLK